MWLIRRSSHHVWTCLNHVRLLLRHPLQKAYIDRILVKDLLIFALVRRTGTALANHRSLRGDIRCDCIKTRLIVLQSWPSRTDRECSTVYLASEIRCLSHVWHKIVIVSLGWIKILSIYMHLFTRASQHVLYPWFLGHLVILFVFMRATIQTLIETG